MRKEKLLLFWANWWAFVIGIKLDRVTVPQYGNVDGNATLFCYFDLEKDTLLNLKWYKNEHEFFRYSLTKTSSPILTFPTEGVFVETSSSGLNQVVLKNLSLSSSGNYRCEVSADLPSFRTLSQHGQLIVVAPPMALPIISCHPQVIQQGDTLNCNCTSYSSKPAASLMFYLNGGKANFGDMIECPPVLESSGLETSMLGLTFQVEAHHLKNGLLEIKCTASVGYNWERSNITLHEASVNPVNAQPSSPGHNRLLSGSSRGRGYDGLITLFTLFITILLL